MHAYVDTRENEISIQELFHRLICFYAPIVQLDLEVVGTEHTPKGDDYELLGTVVVLGSA